MEPESTRVHEGLDYELDRSPSLDDAVFRDDDDPVPNVVAIAVDGLHAGRVGEPHAVADPRVLVDDDAIEDDVAPDAEARSLTARRAEVVGLVEVRAEQ